MLSSMRSERKCFSSPHCAKEITLFQSVLSVCHSMPPFRSVTAVPSEVIIHRTMKLTAHLHLVPSQRMRGSILVLHSNELRYLLHCGTETIWHAPVPVHNSRRFPSVRAVITHLNNVEILCTAISASVTSAEKGLMNFSYPNNF